MQHIVLLIAQAQVIQDGNYLRISNELLSRGYQVDLCMIDSLTMINSRVIAQGFHLTKTITANTPLPQLSNIELTQADIIWTLSLGMRHNFLDKMQLLHCLAQDCWLINSLEALMHFKSKYFLARQSHLFKYPTTYASTNSADLINVIRRQGGQWIAKPPAGSHGNNVFLLHANDSNTQVILAAMTGPNQDQYCLLQPFVEAIRQGEKRVLLAGGQVIGQYLRQVEQGHRTNLATGAKFTACELTLEEQRYCDRIGQFLLTHGAQFVGMDLAFPYVIEFNVVNPGGILTLETLTKQDLTPVMVEQILTQQGAFS